MLLEIKDLKKYFKISKNVFDPGHITLKALDGVNLNIAEKETVGLVGESGCGKSTLGRLIVSLYEPTEGSILFRGQAIQVLKNHDRRAFHRQIQIIFQDPYTSLNPRMTVGQIIEEPLIVQELGVSGERRKRVVELMNLVGLEERVIDRFPHEFSGGQRQRIGIARALVVDPTLIVADEPVSALDVSIQAQIINLLLELQEKLGFALLFISHDLSVVRYLSHRVAVMYLGKIVELAETDKLFASPLHPYTQALFSAIPEPDPLADKKRILLKGEIPSPINPPTGCTFHPRCPIMIEKCITENPPFLPHRPSHYASCWHPSILATSFVAQH